MSIETQHDKSNRRTSFSTAILIVILVLAGVDYVRQAMSAREIAAQWQAKVDSSGLPLPPKGKIAIRAVPGNREHHWRIRMRCRDEFAPYLIASISGFHPNEMKARNGFQHAVFRRDKLTGGKPVSAFHVPAGGLITLDIVLQQGATKDWDVTIRGTGRNYLKQRLCNAGYTIDVQSIELAGERGTEFVEAGQPIRLLEVILDSDLATADQLEGGCFYLVPGSLSKDITRRTKWSPTR